MIINEKKILGEGSFSKVYEAINDNGQKFAIKIENPEKNLLENVQKKKNILIE